MDTINVKAELPDDIRAMFRTMLSEVRDLKGQIAELREEKKKSRSSRMVTVKEAAEITGYNPQSLYRMAKSNTIASYSPQGKVMFRVSDLEAWMNSGRKKNKAEISAEGDRIIGRLNARKS